MKNLIGRRMKMEKQCEYCHKAFEPKRADTKFCSHSCRQMDYMDRKINLSVN
jgi:predicted nucleic acid-binding Zn ribbon protein